jgi:ribonuclease E
MIEHTSPGAEPPPGTGAGDGPAHGLSSESASRAGDGSLEIDSTGGEPAGGSSRAAPVTRRRRRGGAKRRRRAPAVGAPAAPEAREDGEPAGAVALEERSPQPSAPTSVSPPGEEPRRKRSRRRRRRSRSGEPAAPAGNGAPTEAAEVQGTAAEPFEAPAAAGGFVDVAGGERSPGEGAGTRKRRRRRAGRRDDAPASGASRPQPQEGSSGRRRRRRGGQGRRGAPSAPVVLEVIPGEEDELGELAREDLPELPEEADLLALPVPAPETRQPRGRRRAERAPRREGVRGEERGRSRRARRGIEVSDEPAPPRRPARKNLILVNAADREETRVAVVEEGQIVDFQMTVKRHKSLVNDIYRGKVVNLEPAIGAAFIDFGQGRNGFLHTSDVLSVYGEPDWSLKKLLTAKVDPEEWDAESSQPDVGVEVGEAGGNGEAGEDGTEPAAAEAPAGKTERGRRGQRGAPRHRARPRLPITELLEKGQSVVVQVTKDAIGDKGPTLTTYISIPGRYLVLMPSMARTGVSRKIEDEKERRRLKRILESLEIPSGMGVIVRTAGTGATKADLKRDLDYLMLLWESFGQRLELGRGPAPLYEETDVAIRTIRDLFTDDTEAVLVDEPRVFERVREFTAKLMPENVEKVKLHQGNRPLFHTHNVEQDFERIFARRIDLASGGSIVFDQTEALVAIDVNSGKTRSEGFDFEQIALRTNLDAVAEIARQIRLRDLGGIIVCDFIDMLKLANRRAVERALIDALAQDRARSKIGRISQFGLLELTRQRLGPGLSKMLFFNCPRCRGSGRIRTVESRVGATLRRLGSALTLKGFSKVEVRTQPEVVEHLQRFYAQELRDLQVRHEREVELFAVADQVEDCVLRYLRTDGREVRPGGRRKR